MFCQLFRVYLLGIVNQAGEDRATTTKVSSVVPLFDVKQLRFYGECISGDKTLIHYLPCTVPSWHSVSMYFLDGRAATISLREG